MNVLSELLKPYLKDKNNADKIAEELSAKGVVVIKPYGRITCNFEPDQALGTITMNGEEIEVYLGSYTLEPIGMGRDPMTCKMIKPMRFKRLFTMIER